MSSLPPPPPSDATPPPPPGSPAAPGVEGWGGPPPAGYEMPARTKPPRPNVQIASIITAIGGVLLIVGAVLPWLKTGSTTLNGMDRYLIEFEGDALPRKLVNPGGRWIFLGIVLIGFGIAMYLAGRVLAVAIIGIVVAAFSLVSVGVSWSGVNDSKDWAESSLCRPFPSEIDVTCGPSSVKLGPPVGLVGGLAGLGGAIAATAKRRR